MSLRHNESVFNSIEWFALLDSNYVVRIWREMQNEQPKISAKRAAVKDWHADVKLVSPAACLVHVSETFVALS